MRASAKLYLDNRSIWGKTCEHSGSWVPSCCLGHSAKLPFRTSSTDSKRFCPVINSNTKMPHAHQSAAAVKPFPLWTSWEQKRHDIISRYTNNKILRYQMQRHPQYCHECHGDGQRPRLPRVWSQALESADDGVRQQCLLRCTLWHGTQQEPNPGPISGSSNEHSLVSKTYITWISQEFPRIFLNMAQPLSLRRKDVVTEMSNQNKFRTLPRTEPSCRNPQPAICFYVDWQGIWKNLDSKTAKTTTTTRCNENLSPPWDGPQQ